MPTNEERNMAVVTHLLGLVVLFTVYLGAVPALVIWLVYRDKSEYIAENAREAFNFQITMTIAILICSALFCLIVPPFLIPVIIVVMVVFSIIGAVETGKDRTYRYPMTYPFLK